MNHAELITAVAMRTGLQEITVRLVLDEQSRVIAETLQKGEAVILTGIGRLTTKQRAARKARNVHSGEPITIPARTAVAFKASSALKL